MEYDGDKFDDRTETSSMAWLSVDDDSVAMVFK